ncbi:hypothetical protein B1202_07285 [Acinetobacter amyesii]|uniref:Uncharacterized protein n=1 Tax=Acinetobacter amyesii TaxID=2942470 RepID=A0A1T1H161_9GAMM|nr:hypothetical protein B1202_07285 [Acinetobacter amyesii]
MTISDEKVCDCLENGDLKYIQQYTPYFIACEASFYLMIELENSVKWVCSIVQNKSSSIKKPPQRDGF